MSEDYICDDRKILEELIMVRNMSDEEFRDYLKKKEYDTNQ